MQTEYGRFELEKNLSPQPGMEPAVVVHPARSSITISTSLSELLLIYDLKTKCTSDGAGYLSCIVRVRRTNKSETGYPDERFGGFTQLYRARTDY